MTDSGVDVFLECCRCSSRLFDLSHCAVFVSFISPTEESAPPIPPCACGAQRVFEAQLLPSILHVLDVDKYAEKGDGSTTTGLAAAYETGGMNWGNVAIYSCPAACSNEDEYVVVQDSMDERPGPELRRGYEDAEAVVVPEDSKFDDDDDDAEDEGEMECF